MRRAAAWCAFLLSATAPLAGQQLVTVSGRVMRVAGPDTVPVGRTTVVLHRVAREAQGPVDTTLTDGRGRFRFRYAADTAAVFLLSAGFAGIEYFSTALQGSAAVPDSGLVLMVSDTSGSAPVRVASRHIVISKPGEDGLRAALEIVVLENQGSQTRVAGDSARPVWMARLPTGAAGAQAGNGDYSPEALIFRGDSVLLFAPVAPGDKQVIYTYSLPPNPGRVRVPMVDSVAVLNLLLEEVEVPVTGAGLSRAGPTTIENRTFEQWNGPVAGGVVLEIGFGGGLVRWLLPALVSLVAVALALMTVRALRRPAPSPGPPPPLDQLARLDARYAGRQAETPPEEWARYQEERARLKASLAAGLVREERGP